MSEDKKLKLEHLVAALVMALVALVAERRKPTIEQIILGVILALAAVGSILGLLDYAF